MIITEDPALRTQALAALQVEYGMTSHRPGLHQSELSYCLTKSFWDRTAPLPLTEKEIVLFAIGFAAERVMLSREETPKELILDGISCSLDTISLFGPADLKTTRMRAKGRKGEDGFQPPEGWRHQFMAYRYALNRITIEAKMAALKLEQEVDFYGRYQFRQDVIDLWVYADSLPKVEHDFGVIIIHLVEPEISAYRFQFSDEEMEANWARLMTRKTQLESMLETNDPRPFTTNSDWECTHCRYKLQCELTASQRMYK